MIRFLLTLFLLFQAPLAPAAAGEVNRWKRSLRYYQEGQFKRAKDLLLQLVREQPGKAVYWFNLGNSYFMINEPGRAITAYLKVEELASPLAPAAILYRAKALTARGDAESARALLQTLVSRPNLPAAIAEEASRDLMSDLTGDEVTNEALSQYRAGKFARALRLLNRLRVPDENQLLLKALALIKLDREDEAHEILMRLQSTPQLRGLVGTLLDRIRDSYAKPYWLFVEAAGGSDSGLLAFGDVGGGIRLWSENLWYVNTGYTMRIRQTLDHPDESTLAHEVRGNLGRELGSDLFLISPFFVHESWDQSPARSSTGAAIRARAGQPRLEWGGEAEFSLDSSLGTEFEYVEGLRHRYALTLSRLVNPYYVRFQLFYEKADIGDQDLGTGRILPAAYNGWGPSLKILWRFRGGLIAEASILHIDRKYPTISDPGNIRRRDRQLAVGARFTRIFTKQMSAYVSWSQDRNTSTMDASSVNNENFNRTQILAGVIWDVL